MAISSTQLRAHQLLEVLHASPHQLEAGFADALGLGGGVEGDGGVVTTTGATHNHTAVATVILCEGIL